ncbi:MAG TPA: preprotein translocase subunit YajC [Gemmata sp.]|nr:preprotein translocase subunit YajC [Gemmata sp.]
MKSLLLLAEEGQPQQPQGIFSGPTGMLFVVAAIMLFMMMVVFPSQRRASRQQQEMLASLKRGARIVTNGGIVGTIVVAKDGEDEVVIRSEDTRLRIKRNVIGQVLGTDDAEAAKG